MKKKKVQFNEIAVWNFRSCFRNPCVKAYRGSSIPSFSLSFQGVWTKNSNAESGGCSVGFSKIQGLPVNWKEATESLRSKSHNSL
jgi:hypothetical protein